MLAADSLTFLSSKTITQRSALRIAQILRHLFFNYYATGSGLRFCLLLDDATLQYRAHIIFASHRFDGAQKSSHL